MADTIIMVKDVSIAFPAIAEMASIGDGEPAYGARFVIEPGSANAKALDAAMLEAANAKWKEDGPAVLDMLKGDKRVCFEHAPARNKKTGKPITGFEGMFTLGARNAKTQPSVFDQFGKRVEGKQAIERLIYSGAKVNAKIEVWAQDNTYGRRINASLLGVMFAGEGERFGGGSAPASEDDFAGMAQQSAAAEDVL